jgi:hypothetical protein
MGSEARISSQNLLQALMILLGRSGDMKLIWTEKRGSLEVVFFWPCGIVSLGTSRRSVLFHEGIEDPTVNSQRSSQRSTLEDLRFITRFRSEFRLQSHLNVDMNNMPDVPVQVPVDDPNADTEW